MLSSIDLIFTTIANIINIFVKKFPKPKLREIIVNDKEKVDNYYFFPAAARNNRYIKKHVLSNTGTNHIYTVDVFYHLTPKVDESIKRINKTYQIAKEDMKKSIRKGHKINILGQSLGTLFAAKLAANFSCEKLTLVVPGDNLGECAWESWLVGPNARMSGLTKKAYVKAYGDYRGEDYVHKIKAKKVSIYLAGIDWLIPAKRGARFAKMMKKYNKNTKVLRWWMLGHMLTIFLSAWMISKENEEQK